MLEFERHWGLGSSSTLIANIAAWAGVDGFQLYKAVSNGSGYDLAVALQNKHLQYKLKDGEPEFEAVHWNPDFVDDLFFVALGKKQVSSVEVEKYRNSEQYPDACKAIDAINKAILAVNELNEFETLIKEHEAVLSATLNKKSIQQELFPDYTGSMKSLGAWGGDLILASRIGEGITYFHEKGYPEIIPFRELVMA
jgi:mevalonate kinase